MCVGDSPTMPYVSIDVHGMGTSKSIAQNIVTKSIKPFILTIGVDMDTCVTCNTIKSISRSSFLI